MKRLLLLAACLLQEATPLEKLAALEAATKDARTMSVEFVQLRKTPLMDEAIRSTGSIHYRREPLRLVFAMDTSQIHVEERVYQVYRPAEKQLEIVEFEDPDRLRWMFLAFRPEVEQVKKAFAVKPGEAASQIVLDPTSDGVRRVLTRLQLTLSTEGTALSKVEYTNAESEEVAFELSGRRLDPELKPGTFELNPPDDVRIIRRKIRK